MRAAVVLAILAACADPTIAVEDYNLALARADCERDTRCGIYDTVDRCLAFKRLHDPITPSIAAAVAAGLVTYDDLQAAQCAAEHASASCSLVAQDVRVTPTVVCRGVLRSGRLLGDPCAIDEECASRHCSSSTTSEACNMGTCVEPLHLAAPGQDCTAIDCAPDSFCAPSVSICVPHLRQGMSCYAGFECDFGLDCFDTCEPQPQLGDPCPTLQGFPTCGNQSGVMCDLATGACAAPLHQGDPCDPDDDLCASGYLECDRDHRRCEPFPAVGEPCGLPDYRCAAGAICTFSGEGSPGLCLPFVDDGSPCTGSDQLCASGVCDNTTGLCVEPAVCI
jgi:hypothetical protein